MGSLQRAQGKGKNSLGEKCARVVGVQPRHAAKKALLEALAFVDATSVQDDAQHTGKVSELAMEIRTLRGFQPTPFREEGRVFPQ